jgi:glycosyltransferase involved in cell wall biosynthesis
MVGSEFPPIAAGGGYHIYNLSKKLVERGYKVTVFTRGSQKKTYYEEVDGIFVYRVRYIPVYPFHLQSHGIFVNRLLRSMESNFDLIHLHNSNIPVVHTSLPTVVTVHGTMQGYVNNRKALDLQSLVVKTFSRMYVSIDRKVIESANKVIAVSNACARELQDYYGIKDVDVVYNGVDTNFFIPAEEKEWEEPYILYTGRLSPEKGLLDLVESAKYICQDYPEIKFVIIGIGPLERRLRKLAHNLDLNKSISFLGYMDQNKLVKYYQNAMVYVLPSYIEGLSTTLLEAMSCGIPTVATNIAANSEVVVDNETGILVPPRDSKALADAIIYLLENEDIRESMGKNARKKVEDYSWNKIAEETEKVYNEVMNGFYGWR